MDNINFEALFLGPQAENHRFFKEQLNFLIDEHIHWRRNFHPDDKPCITLKDQQKPDFINTQQRIQEVLLQLSSKLKTSSMPWHSPRYVGHMTSDVLLSAQLAYMATMLYNPNNVAWEASPATTSLELEVGLDFAGMMGFDREKAFGHITSGGTVANYEALWIARNLRSIPPALREVRPDLVEGMGDGELRNLSPGRILDLLDVAMDDIDAIKERSVRGRGVCPFGLGKVFVSRTRHYSWSKAVDILGIGLDNLVMVDVRDDFRMDTEDLDRKIGECIEAGEPVMAVVGVLGTTEEAAVDPIHEIVGLRQKYENHGTSFFIHVDAAYGGYARSVFLDAEGRFLGLTELKSKIHNLKIISETLDWPADEVYRAFRAIEDVDSVTIDPHKLGYMPYQAGAVVFRDKRVRNLISYFAPYVFDKLEEEKNPRLLGSYIFEGSKAGAAAAMVWASHRCVDLNINGYGKIIGEGIEGATRIYNQIRKMGSIKAGGREYRFEPLTSPDMNIVVYALNEVGNTDLEKMNALNRSIKAELSYKFGTIHSYDFIVSSTELSHEEYRDTPLGFLERLGIPKAEWEKVGSVFVLRSTIMSPYLTLDYTEEDYMAKFFTKLESVLETVG